jgi:hypothetical protein
MQLLVHVARNVNTRPTLKIMNIAAVALIIVVSMLLVATVREAIRFPLFLPAFAFLILLFWVVLGNPVALATSGGGWIIVMFMLWGARILATTIHAVIDAARDDIHDRHRGE